MSMLVVLVVIGCVGFAAYNRHSQEGARLRKAATQLTAPTGWRLVGREEDKGSNFICFISCPHVEISLWYQTSAVPHGACDAIRAQVGFDIAVARNVSWDAGCGWRAPLNSVGTRADVRAFALPGESVGRVSALPDGLIPNGNKTYVRVTFSGGPT